MVVLEVGLGLGVDVEPGVLGVDVGSVRVGVLMKMD